MKSLDELITEASDCYRDKQTTESYTFLCSIVTLKNEEKWLNGDYNDELDPISKKMRRIEIKYGLNNDETFFIDKAPKPWLDLDKQYNQVIFEKLSEIFCTIGFPEIGKEIKKTLKSSKINLINIILIFATQQF